MLATREKKQAHSYQQHAFGHKDKHPPRLKETLSLVTQYQMALNRIAFLGNSVLVSVQTLS